MGLGFGRRQAISSRAGMSRPQRTPFKIVIANDMLLHKMTSVPFIMGLSSLLLVLLPFPLFSFSSNSLLGP